MEHCLYVYPFKKKKKIMSNIWLSKWVNIFNSNLTWKKKSRRPGSNPINNLIKFDGPYLFILFLFMLDKWVMLNFTSSNYHILFCWTHFTLSLIIFLMQALQIPYWLFFYCHNRQILNFSSSICSFEFCILKKTKKTHS